MLRLFFYINECLVAVRAPKWPFVRMLVSCCTSLCWKFLFTMGATEQLFFGVSDIMALQIKLTYKSFITNWTFEWPITCVYQYMSPQNTSFREFLFTMGTAVGFSSCVCSLMFLQITRRCEILITMQATEFLCRFITIVNFLMSLQIPWLNEFLVTIATAECLVFGMGVFMWLQIIFNPKPFTTTGTFEWLLTCMNTCMSFQLTLFQEFHRAILATMCFFTCMCSLMSP